jgi:hypothetical protein
MGMRYALLFVAFAFLFGLVNLMMYLAQHDFGAYAPIILLVALVTWVAIRLEKKNETS